MQGSSATVVQCIHICSFGYQHGEVKFEVLAVEVICSVVKKCVAIGIRNIRIAATIKQFLKYISALGPSPPTFTVGKQR